MSGYRLICPECGAVRGDERDIPLPGFFRTCSAECEDATRAREELANELTRITGRPTRDDGGPWVLRVRLEDVAALMEIADDADNTKRFAEWVRGKEASDGE